jgi:tRNA(Ile)-lysidine synthase
LIPRSRLDPAVLAWSERASRRSRWGVGFSGGPDSLALLLLVWSHWPARRKQIVALHFDHRLRGMESRADARFCRRVCRTLGVPFVAASWAQGRPGASEAEARAARHAFFARHSRIMWLGHQQDDIAETLLMRLARGSGTAGLAAPRPVQLLGTRRVNLRPLLGLKKAELVRALREAGVEWREDSSNAGPAYLRNRMRHQVVARWVKAAERDAVAGAARSRELLEEDDAALEAWVRELDPLDRAGRLVRRRLAGRPMALWRRALHLWLVRNLPEADLSRQAFDTLLRGVVAGGRLRQSLGTSHFAECRGDLLMLVSRAAKPARIRRSAN